MTEQESQERRFTGFSRKSFQFLKNLKTHNDKAWFEAHRSDYEQTLLELLRDLVTDLADFMLVQPQELLSILQPQDR